MQGFSLRNPLLRSVPPPTRSATTILEETETNDETFELGHTAQGEAGLHTLAREYFVCLPDDKRKHPI